MQADAEALRPEYERRAAVRAEQVVKDLEKNAAAESTALRKILEAQRDRIAKKANDPALDQLIFDYDEKENRQLAGDRRHWRARLQQLDHEIIEEPEKVRQSYDVRGTRFEPVGLVYLWPVAG
jgi:hypothetical protein